MPLTCEWRQAMSLDWTSGQPLFQSAEIFSTLLNSLMTKNLADLFCWSWEVCTLHHTVDLAFGTHTHVQGTLLEPFSFVDNKIVLK